MHRIIAMALFFLVSTLAMAAPVVDTSGLTTEQIQQLASQVQQMKQADAGNISATVRKEAAAWAELGTNVGLAMVSAAKEIGIAANEFSQTPLGKTVTLVIMYKIIGHDLLGVVVGSLVLLIGISVGIKIWFGSVWCNCAYEYKPFLFGLWNRRVIVKREMSGDLLATKIIAGAVTFIMTCLVGLNIIF